MSLQESSLYFYDDKISWCLSFISLTMCESLCNKNVITVTHRSQIIYNRQKIDFLLFDINWSDFNLNLQMTFTF